MNYKIYKFVNNTTNLVQQAINEGIPVYILPFLLRDIISKLTPIINQTIQEESNMEQQLSNNIMQQDKNEEVMH